MWATTSNPAAATADGIAIAVRAGAAVADLEFCQFHPTVLHVDGETPFLVSEAVRGEGAYLRDHDGNRFMMSQHELAELAPRDVVARGIQTQMVLDHSDHAYLDLRHLDGPAMRRRFPTIAHELDARGIDLASDLIPVAPAAHYFMGGVVADESGVTSLPGLLAIGEAACTGVHGANRLASNSLLEGLVFGRKSAERLNQLTPKQGDAQHQPIQSSSDTQVPASALPGTRRKAMQQVMSRYVSVVRDATGLQTAIRELELLATAPLETEIDRREAWISANTALASLAIAQAALLREESRGAHFRSDFPERDAQLDGVHVVLDTSRGSWAFETLADAMRGTVQ